MASTKMKTRKDYGRWLTFGESIKSTTARNLKIDNTPNDEQYNNIQTLYNHVYGPLCDVFGKLPVNSVFRSPKLNKAVGGSTSSQHMKGQAIDIDCDGLGPDQPTNKSLFAYIRERIDFDQMIYEDVDQYGNPGWIHVSYVSKKENRKQALMMKIVRGKKVYNPY